MADGVEQYSVVRKHVKKVRLCEMLDLRAQLELERGAEIGGKSKIKKPQIPTYC